MCDARQAGKVSLLLKIAPRSCVSHLQMLQHISSGNLLLPASVYTCISMTSAKEVASSALTVCVLAVINTELGKGRNHSALWRIRLMWRIQHLFTLVSTGLHKSYQLLSGTPEEDQLSQHLMKVLLFLLSSCTIPSVSNPPQPPAPAVSHVVGWAMQPCRQQQGGEATRRCG